MEVLKDPHFWILLMLGLIILGYFGLPYIRRP